MKTASRGFLDLSINTFFFEYIPSKEIVERWKIHAKGEGLGTLHFEKEAAITSPCPQEMPMRTTERATNL